MVILVEDTGLEGDHRWMVFGLGVPGSTVYGATQDQALARLRALLKRIRSGNRRYEDR